MPHYRDWFAIAANKANSYVDEDVDGYMKLGDIKGEFAGAYDRTIGGFQADALTNAVQEGFTWEGASDIWTTGGPSTFKADALTKGGQEVGLDVGPVNQTANVWTTGPVTSVADALKNAGQEGFTWAAAADIRTTGGTSTFTPVANRNGTATLVAEADSLLLPQTNDNAAGWQLNPNQMQPAEFFSHAMEWFAPGSAVESLVSNSDQMFSPISGEGVFAQRDGLGATASVIVGDNHF
jgi:hypothetical protein